MALSIKPVVSAPLAGFCTVISFFAVIILSAFGFFFARRAGALTLSEEDPDWPGLASTTCYLAALVYAAFILFCGLQVGVNARYPRGVQL